jgi:Calcineurin-like phosphoesterase
LEPVKKYWVIGDIHGMYDTLLKLLEVMKQNGFDLSDPKQVLVQLGDRNDRGPDSYEVNEFFKTQQIMYPGQVICLMGNHDRFMITAADGHSDLMYFNGGDRTARSYVKGAGLPIIGNPRNQFSQAFKKTGHYDWIKSCPLYYETNDYFFSHAPIPLEQYRQIPAGYDFRLDEHTLTWSFGNGRREELWIDPNPVPVALEGNFYPGSGKIACYGHIHGMYKLKGHLVVPGVRMYGNAILLDTGCGCHEDAYLTCVRLPDMKVMNSKGEVYDLEEIKRQEDVELERAIPDKKVDF